MIESAVDCVAGLFFVTNSLRVFFYAPQIRAVLKAEDGAKALSLATWSFWTFANLTAMLYGWFVIHDGAFTAIFAGNLACTAVVTLIAARKRLLAQRLNSKEATMTRQFEDLMASARQARSDEVKRLTGLAVSALARAANRALASSAPTRPLVPLAWRLSPEDRPGC